MKLKLKHPKVKLYTDPNYFGAEVDDSAGEGLPVKNLPLDKLSGFEPDEKMEQPESQAKLASMVKKIKTGGELPPILVREYEGGYQVIDGHHRFHAAKMAGKKEIPAKVIPSEDIKVIKHKGVIK